MAKSGILGASALPHNPLDPRFASACFNKIGGIPCITTISTYIAAHSSFVLSDRVFQWLLATFTRQTMFAANNRRSHYMTVSINNAGASGNAVIPPLEIGEAVRRFREASGYSIEDLAVTCGLTDVEISKVENGEDKDAVRVKRIAAALQMPASTFDTL
jgi:DNA-binding XRE family transcriptional regulator